MLVDASKVKSGPNTLRRRLSEILCCLVLLSGGFDALAVGDAAQLISVSIPPATLVMPRTVFTQTWTMQNIGTNTWSPGQSGYTLNLASTDTLAAVPLTANADSTWYLPCANNEYGGFVVSDGYFWTNGSSYGNFGAHAPVPTAELGDDCAHFISCCIGSESHQRGGGLKIPSRVPPTYGEPGVARLVNTCLIGPGYATEVLSLSSLSPGDLIAWNWEGDTNIANLDHATLYLGNDVLASHSASCLDMAPSFFQDSLPDWRWHLIHIFDAPTITASHSGKNFVLSWGTNWTGYSLYSASSLTNGTSWTKVSKSPVVVGAFNFLTNTMSSGAAFYRLMLP